MLCRVLDKLFQLDLHPNRPCMMMIGVNWWGPPSVADSYDVYDIFTGSSTVLSRRSGSGRRPSLNKHVSDANDTLDLTIIVCVWQRTTTCKQRANRTRGVWQSKRNLGKGTTTGSQNGSRYADNTSKRKAYDIDYDNRTRRSPAPMN